MAYLISYDFKEIKKEKIKRRTVMSYAIMVLGIAGALLCAQLGGCLLDMLLLGKQEQTRSAVEAMAESIRSGSTVDEAISVFCGVLDE